MILNNSDITLPILLAKYITKGRYFTPKHLILLNKKLWQIQNGTLKRLIITMPPRHGKSEMTSKYFPACYLLNNPEKRIILSSYESDFAASWSSKALQVYKQINPNNLTMERQDEWITKQGGSMFAVGVGGAITGRGADLFIIDDPIKNPEQANSKTYRRKCWEWFESVAYTRLEPNGAMIVIMTRWHYDDLVGRLIDNMNKGGEKWELVNFPAIAEENDILGRSVGDALFPERYPIETLETIKKQGSYTFNSLYQQRPSNEETEILKRKWWQYYEYQPSFNYIVQSWDTAFKDKEKNDYSVCTTWGVTNTGYYLIDLFHRKVDYPLLKIEVQSLFNKYNPDIVLIEDKASGQSLIQDLKYSTSLPIKAIQVDKDKVTRAYLITPLLESQKVFLPLNASFLADFLDETSLFPFSAHDDIVDSTTQALNYCKNLQHDIKINTGFAPITNDISIFSL